MQLAGTKPAYHLVATADENGDGPRVLALLDDQHPVLGGPEGDFLHQPCETQLLGCKLREARHYPAPRGNGDQLWEGYQRIFQITTAHLPFVTVPEASALGELPALPNSEPSLHPNSDLSTGAGLLAHCTQHL